MRPLRFEGAAMTTTIMDEFILPTLIRYIDHYHWSFNIAMRLINMYHGTGYTEKELKALYRKSQKIS